MESLNKTIETLMFSLPSLINVGALLMLVFFIFSVLGVFLFKKVTYGININNYNNFFNFGNAMITLFRCATGEDSSPSGILGTLDNIIFCSKDIYSATGIVIPNTLRISM